MPKAEPKTIASLKFHDTPKSRWVISLPFVLILRRALAAEKRMEKATGPTKRSFIVSGNQLGFIMSTSCLNAPISAACTIAGRLDGNEGVSE